MVVTDIGGGVLYVMDARWFWPVTFSMTASFAWYLLTVRALIQTGPPINPVRWWWPWGSPRA